MVFASGGLVTASDKDAIETASFGGTPSPVVLRALVHATRRSISRVTVFAFSLLPELSEHALREATTFGRLRGIRGRLERCASEHIR